MLIQQTFSFLRVPRTLSASNIHSGENTFLLILEIKSSHLKLSTANLKLTLTSLFYP